MRRLTVFLPFFATSLASADRLIDIPIARKVPLGEFRLEGQLEASRGRTQRYFLATGLTQNLDVELRTERLNRHSTTGTFDVGYNIQPPLVNLSPGISVGVQDALDITRDGRRGYLAVTFRDGLDTSAQNAYVDTTLGIRVGRETLPFVGVDLPLESRVHALFEHNGKRLAACIELKPMPMLNLRFIFERNDTLISAQLTHKFRS